MIDVVLEAAGVSDVHKGVPELLYLATSSWEDWCWTWPFITKAVVKRVWCRREALKDEFRADAVESCSAKR